MSVTTGRVRVAGWRRAVALAVAATVFPVSGCSFLFLDRPREYAPSEKIDCTTTYGLPSLDLALTAAHIASIAILASASGSAFGGAKARETLAQGDLFWLVMNGVSGGWGFYKVGQCKDLVAEDERYHNRPSPPPRPRPRPPRIAPDATTPPEAAQPIAPVEPVPAAPPPAATPPAPTRPPVPQKADDE